MEKITDEEKDKAYLYSHYLKYNDDIHDEGLGLKINIHVTDIDNPDPISNDFNVSNIIHIELYYSPPVGTIGTIVIEDDKKNIDSIDNCHIEDGENVIKKYMKEYAKLYAQDKVNMRNLLDMSINLYNLLINNINISGRENI